MIEAIKDGRIQVVAAVESLDANGVELADGTRMVPDAVIAATGFRPGLEPCSATWACWTTDGTPRASREAAAAPGLRFVGYRPRPAHIAYMGGEARRAARAIARPLAATG